MPIFQRWGLRLTELSHVPVTQYIPNTQVWMNLAPMPLPAPTTTMLLCLDPRVALRRCPWALHLGAGILIAEKLGTVILPSWCSIDPYVPSEHPTKIIA